jgi:tmRNA-binding protein
VSRRRPRRWTYGSPRSASTPRPWTDAEYSSQKRQLRSWDKQVREKGITIVPLALYFKGHLVKVEMALVKGRKLHDMREDVKRRTAEREIEREVSRRR